MLLRPAKEVLYYIKVSDCERYIWEREKLLFECITMEVKNYKKYIIRTEDIINRFKFPNNAIIEFFNDRIIITVRTND